MAVLRTHHHAIERGVSFFQLQPGQAAPSGNVGAVRILDDQPFVIARARGDEGGFNLLFRTGAGDLGEPERAQLLEQAAPLRKRLVDEVLTIQPEKVESHELRGNLFAQEQVRFAPAQALLQFGVGQDLVAAHRDDFAVADEILRNLAGEVGDFLKTAGDLLQVARVNRRGFTDLMDLGADAVVLVFDPDRDRRSCDFHGQRFGRGRWEMPVANTLPNIGGGFLGRSEHVLHGAKREQSHRGQLAVQREHGGFSNVAHEQIDLLDLVERRIKGPGDCFLDQSFLQTDPQITGQDLDQVFSFQRRTPRQRLREQRQFFGGPARGQELIEEPLQAGDGIAGSSGMGGAFENFVAGFAEVAMLEIDLAKLVLVEVADRAERVANDRPAKLQRFIMTGRKRVPGKPDRGRAEPFWIQ
jgi:hypothetical protein